MVVTLFNLPFECWSHNCLTKIGNALGQTIDLDLREGESLIYERICIIAIRDISQTIKFHSGGNAWKQCIEIVPKFYYLKCRRRNHSTERCRRFLPTIREIWREKKKRDAKEERPMGDQNINQSEMEQAGVQAYYHVKNWQLIIAKLNEERLEGESRFDEEEDGGA